MKTLTKINITISRLYDRMEFLSKRFAINGDVKIQRQFKSVRKAYLKLERIKAKALNL